MALPEGSPGTAIFHRFSYPVRATSSATVTERQTQLLYTCRQLLFHDYHVSHDSIAPHLSSDWRRTQRQRAGVGATASSMDLLTLYRFPFTFRGTRLSVHTAWYTHDVLRWILLVSFLLSRFQPMHLHPVAFFPQAM